MKKSRIVQFTPAISFGDAVSNDIIAMSEVLTSLGYENEIVSIGIGNRVKQKVIQFDKFRSREDDIFIYHMSIGSALTNYIINENVKKKIMVYHNITPQEFFEGFPPLKIACQVGRIELEKLAPYMDFSMADSDYNKDELDNLGYKNTVTLPIVFDKKEYLSVIPDEKIIKKYKKDDGYVNILFVGRIAPNKKHQDIITSFHFYNKYINPKSRLFLVGAANSLEVYKDSLDEYIKVNEIQNVFFSGHVKFPEIIAYYKIADLFLCESEHEGFCVPLLEAMTFDIPILAYHSSAIPYTLANSGVIFREKDHKVVAEIINSIVTDEKLKTEIIRKQKERLDFFDINKTKEKFSKMISLWLNEME